MNTKKTMALSLALALGLGVGTANAAPVAWDGHFSLYDPGGGQMDTNDAAAGLEAYVTGEIDVAAGTFTLSSTDTFFGSYWTASGGTLYTTPGTYTISTVDASGASGGDYTITVAAGQILGHFDWAWGANTGMDLVNLWDVETSGGVTTYTSVDIDGDGIPGIPNLDGAILGFNFNFNMQHPAVPVPAAIWLLGSGLLGLGFGMKRKRPPLS